jgi:hypothetical protein
MALRINRSVVRGEIDNRTKGQVAGSIWLIGKEKPVTLHLDGNCWPDLAGCLLRFENPDPRPAEEEHTEAVAEEQSGVAGDITASRKVRVFDVPLTEALAMAREGGAPPEHLANSLYIEWFSQANGRVVIDTTGYRIKISEPAWALSAEEAEQQVAAAQQAMRDWLDRLEEALEQREDESSVYDPEQDKPLDEFGYEKLMRESDARTDKYMELLEKYKDRPDQEKIVAKEMGWEWLEEALEANERGALPAHDEMEVPELIPNPATEGVDWVRDDNGQIRHPLSKRAFDSSISIWHFCEDRGLLGENGDADLFEMVSEFQTTGAKLAGALNSLAYDDEESARDGGFVVAALKRALNYLHNSINASERVAAKKLLPEGKLQSFRAELFNIREQVLSLMQRYREKSG